MVVGRLGPVYPWSVNYDVQPGKAAIFSLPPEKCDKDIEVKLIKDPQSHICTAANLKSGKYKK